MAETNPQSPTYKISLDGTEVESGHLQGFTIDRDMNQPDMAAIVLTNQNAVQTASGKLKIGAAVKVEVPGVDPPIFVGELIGIEPIYRGGEPARVRIRAVNKLHRLLRKRKSRTFTDKKDQEVFSTIAGEHGLSLEYKHSENQVVYKHIYQHNQTDLEFLRMRAARVGALVWCDDKKLHVKFPTLDEASGAPEMTVDESGSDATVKAFMPRLSSANAVKKVTVKGWNPETKEPITATANVESSKLGSQTSVAASSQLAADETFTVDHPIWSVDEAKLIAKGRLTEMALTYITGTLELQSYVPAIKLGTTIDVRANTQPEDPFNGKYYVMGLSFTHNAKSSQSKGGTQPPAMIVKFARDAEKK